MSIFAHLVPASIQQSRMSGRGDDTGRLLSRLDGLLESLRTARGTERAAIHQRLQACEDELIAHLERCGDGMLAAALMHRVGGDVLDG